MFVNITEKPPWGSVIKAIAIAIEIRGLMVKRLRRITALGPFMKFVQLPTIIIVIVYRGIIIEM